MCKKENFYTYLCSILLIMYEYLHNYELPQIQHNLCKIFTHFFYSVPKSDLRNKFFVEISSVGLSNIHWRKINKNVTKLLEKIILFGIINKKTFKDRRLKRKKKEYKVVIFCIN